MADTVDDLSINYEEDGKLIVKELKKEVLTKGAWATVMFLYQTLDKKTDIFGKKLISIRRYQKSDGQYRPKSKFNISSMEQAKKICEIIHDWESDLE